MRSLRAAVLVFVACVLASCITGDAVKQLQPGMTRADVIQTMGPPDGVQTAGEFEALKYSNRLMSGWSWDRTDYFVVLERGRVVEYGNGVVRQQAPNTLGLVTGAALLGQATGATPVAAGTTCMKKREWTSGFNRNCVYDCLGSEAVQTVPSAQMCPLSIQR